MYYHHNAFFSPEKTKKFTQCTLNLKFLFVHVTIDYGWAYPGYQSLEKIKQKKEESFFFLLLFFEALVPRVGRALHSESIGLVTIDSSGWQKAPNEIILFVIVMLFDHRYREVVLSLSH